MTDHFTGCPAGMAQQAFARGREVPDTSLPSFLLAPTIHTGLLKLHTGSFPPQGSPDQPLDQPLLTPQRLCFGLAAASSWRCVTQGCHRKVPPSLLIRVSRVVPPVAWDRAQPMPVPEVPRCFLAHDCSHSPSAAPSSMHTPVSTVLFLRAPVDVE